MERKYLKDLITWKDDPDRKPLMVWGARQVGKSYLIEELFAKVYYPGHYLRIDCSEDNDFTNYVMQNRKLSKVLDYLLIHYGFQADQNHLLIFDEAQECLPVIQMMKQFCEQRRDIPLIVTGSLVRIKILRDAHKRGGYAKNETFLFPVGKINQLYMAPLTFDEFLYNDNRAAYAYIKSHFEERKPIDATLHQEFLDIFYDYLFVGGMPEVAVTFLNHRENRMESIEKVVDKTREIYDDYLADMDLYQASPESIVRSRAIYKDIYKQLNKENKNFKFSFTESGAKSRDMANPIAWLLLKEEDSLTRLYLSDMGMFTYQSGLNVKTFLSQKDNVLSGIYFENYVSIELDARRIGLFYWRGKRDSEFEFILDIDGKVIPVDVKKKRGSLHSLEEFRSLNQNHIAIKISANQYGYDDKQRILTLPFYDVPFFLDDLQKGAIYDEQDLVKRCN